MHRQYRRKRLTSSGQRRYTAYSPTPEKNSILPTPIVKKASAEPAHAPRKRRKLRRKPLFDRSKHPRLAHIEKILAYTPLARRLVFGAGALIVLLVLVQLFYPAGNTLPLMRVDGVSVGGMPKTEAATKLNAAYDASKMTIYMGNNKKPVATPTLKQAAVKVDNAPRMAEVSYPWYLRIIPTSLFWAHGVESAPAPKFSTKTDEYIEKTLMPQCRKAPVNASLVPKGDTLTVVTSQNGGKCEVNDVTKTVKAVRPNLKQQTTVRAAMVQLNPEISNETAKKTADVYNKRLKKGITIAVNNQPVVAPATAVLQWIDFAPENAALVPTTNPDKLKTYADQVLAPRVNQAPGTSLVTTVDFTEVSRTNGNPGRALDLGATARSIDEVVRGKAPSASAVTKVVPPLEKFTRTYTNSDAGLNALLENFAKDHSGSFGISYAELEGRKRHANYNGDKQYVTASTFKLFVAYSLLKRIDAGTKDWGSNATCFNKMISLSDNACAEMFLADMKPGNVSNEINAIGLTNSNFTKAGGPYTTANDLVKFLGMLQMGQNFSASGRTHLIDAMKGNVYRNGVPAGASGQVADKVGFMNGLFHDAAIVYSPGGTYVLAVMTDGSNWATIADLTRQLEAMRAR